MSAVTRQQTDTRPPLRDIAVAQRAASLRAEAPAVVHVTIDRIDVRAPGTAAPSERRLNPKPRTASTVSLSDYLRQHERSRNGGGK